MILERRLAKSDYPGFSDETINLRNELLKDISRPLLDTDKRREFEVIYQNTDSKNGSTLFLNASNGYEVAGLLLLLESRQFEDCLTLAYDLNRKDNSMTGPHQNSYADLSLLIGYATLAHARELKSKRYYEFCARVLQNGLSYIKEKSTLTRIEKEINQELEDIIPFRILDLLSRDTGESVRDLGIELLNDFVIKRGGLDEESSLYMKDEEFKSFFRQIKYFLTVQEQIDLYQGWYKAGSKSAGFLLGISLVAYGFARRKPERLVDALEVMKNLDSTELREIIAYISLLLGKIDIIEDLPTLSGKDFGISPSESSESILGQLCSDCREWLKQDVLDGYRDLEGDPDLEAYFSDRDVTSFIENQDNLVPPQKSLNKISFGPIEFSHKFLSKSSQPKRSGWDDSCVKAEVKTDRTPRHSKNQIQKQVIQKALIIGCTTLVISLLLWLGLGKRNNNRQELLHNNQNQKVSSPELSEKIKVQNQVISHQNKKKIDRINTYPDKAYLLSVLAKWLEIKTLVLSGSKIPENISLVGTNEAIERLRSERKDDKFKEETQRISAQLIDLKIINRQNDTIEVEATLSYSDERLSKKNTIIEKTPKHVFKKRYILVNRGSKWQVL